MSPLKSGWMNSSTSRNCSLMAALTLLYLAIGSVVADDLQSALRLPQWIVGKLEDEQVAE